MKRAVSVIIIMALLVGMAGTALGADSIGTVLKDNAEKQLKRYLSMYKIRPNSVDGYLDVVYAEVIMYFDGQIFLSTEMAAIIGQDGVEPIIKGYSDVLTYVCGLRSQYSDGEITKQEYKEKIFNVIESFIK